MVIAVGEEFRNLGGGTAGEADQAAAVLLEQFPVDARTLVEPFQVGLGHELEKVLITGIVPGDQDEVVGRTFLGLRSWRLPRATYISQPMMGLMPASLHSE